MKIVDRIEQWPLDKLIPYAKNSRTHSEEQIAQIAGSIKAFGFTNPILVGGDGVIVAGHGRLSAARQLGLKQVPVIVLDHLSETERRALVIADNKLALNAGWDEEILQLEIEQLRAEDFDIDLLGFTEEELQAFEPEEIPEFQGDEDEVPEPPEEPVTKLGDVWLLGKHRVMCGDSTSVDAVDKLMKSVRADLCFTSPPYALGKSAALSGNKNISKRGVAYDEHQDDSDSWSTLMSGWWAASLPFVSSWVVNVQPLAGNKRDLFRWINDRVDRLVDVATWDKGHAAPQMASGVMSSRYEWIIIFGDDGASRVIPFSSWHGTVQSVYDAPPQRKNEFADVHGATMPTHLAEWVCNTLCDKAKIVFDPFGGTGTTMIACEKIGKFANLMEISPRYVDVIVKRWQDFTGKQATLEATGQLFDELSHKTEALPS
jgi:ParB-like chromosome segregation protein Spo0J